MKQRRFTFQTKQAVFVRGSMRKVIVEAHDNFAILRAQGLENDYAIPWATIYRFAQAQLAERALKAQKAELGLG